MASIRWAVMLLAIECLVCLSVIPRSEWSAILAGLFFVLFLLICHLFGTSDKTTTTTDSRKVQP